MPFEGSWLWKLRQKVGTDLVLAPGSVVVAERASGDIVLIRRTDTGEWSVPGGCAEEGDTFAATAIHELAEETGLQARADDLVPFACLSEPRWMRFTFPNGDTLQSFNLCYWLRTWTGEPGPDGDESSDVAFFARSQMPISVAPFTERVLALFDLFRKTGAFQNS